MVWSPFLLFAVFGSCDEWFFTLAVFVVLVHGFDVSYFFAYVGATR